MTFEEILDHAIAMLQRRRRVTYNTLKLQFTLDDEQFAALKDELLYSQPHVVDDAGRGLIWTDDTATTLDLSPSPQPPALAESQSGPPAQVASPPAAPQTTDAERRQLTVMFCDLVDSTTLSGRLDPEDYREVVRAYQGAGAAVIQHFDGYIAQHLGDGLLVYFGYPQAHEDDAQRAVRAGLGIVEAMRELNGHLERRTGVRLAVRVGIHTGLVVVGEMGGGNRQEQLALGETPNVAARLQGLAAPDTVAISAATFRLVRGYFTYQHLGVHVLRGVAVPLQLYRILAESEAQSRLDVAGATGFTPLVGRESEVTLLLERWAQSQDGMGQVVLLRGEAGIGKSRLVEVLREHGLREGATRIAFRCSPYYQNSVLYPIVAHLQRFLQWHRDDTPEARLDKIERVLQTYRFPGEEGVPLFAALLSMPLPERYPPLTLTPQRQRHKTHEALVAWLLEEAARQPILAVWEDLHWADPSTLEVLRLVLDQAPTARMLTLLTGRLEFRPPWAAHVPMTQVTLTRLGRPQVETMIANITGGKALPTEMVQQIVAKTDGVPLFVEELVKMVLESGLVREEDAHYVLTGPLPSLAIPSTLHDSLMARLDRLSTVRDLAQLGAVLGREFSYELLQAVSLLDDTRLQQGLAQLVDAELVYQRGLPPRSQYLFKHALIQDASYQSLLKSTRQRYHRQIAQVLEAQFPETAAAQPELLAQHYTEAGLQEEAIPYWHKAGQRAIQRTANLEAIAHLTRGLELLALLPDTPQWVQQELGLQTTLGPALMATKGYAAPEVAKTFARARELCQQLGETPQTFVVLRGLWGFYTVRGALQTARELGEQLLRLAQTVQDPALLLEAHYGLGATFFYLGEFTLAREHSEQGMVYYDPQKRRSHSALQDPGVACLSYTAWALWYLGYPEQALNRSSEALTLARELAHPISGAWAMDFAAMLHQHRREGQAAQERAEAAITICTEQDFAFWLVVGTILQGWALAEQGQVAEGAVQMQQGIAAWRATGSELARPYFLALLAETLGQGGQPQAGLAALAEAVALADRTLDRFHAAELYRLQGELTLQQGGVPNFHAVVEASFWQAIDVARTQQAKSLELRAATSLARLWQQQGKCTEAYDMLAHVYGWFTEGFDTADLQEAKALLETLA